MGEREVTGSPVKIELRGSVSAGDPDLAIISARMRRHLTGDESDCENTQEVLTEITFGEDTYDKDGVKRGLALKDDNYLYILFGKRYKDNPDVFSADRFLVFNSDELPVVMQLIHELSKEYRVQRSLANY